VSSRALDDPFDKYALFVFHLNIFGLLNGHHCIVTLNSEDQVQRALLSQALSIGKEYRSVLESCVATFDSAAKR